MLRCMNLVKVHYLTFYLQKDMLPVHIILIGTTVFPLTLKCSVFSRKARNTDLSLRFDFARIEIMTSCGQGKHTSQQKSFHWGQNNITCLELLHGFLANLNHHRGCVTNNIIFIWNLLAIMLNMCVIFAV